MSGQRQTSNIPTLLAFMALVAAGLGLLFLSALVLPQLFGLAVVVAGFFLFVAFHYVVWGWWVSKLPGEDDEPE
jgi:hypothetical protein